jgi:Zn-dependent M28 family amino/carboxypeptidase
LEDDGQAAFRYLTQVSAEFAPRASGTGEELAAAGFLASKFEGFGYDTSLQEFTVETLSRELSGLALGGPEPEEVDVIPLVGSATGIGVGALTSAGLAREEDIPEEGLDGKVALVERGLIRFSEKVRRLAEAGAVGAVIYNNSQGNFQGVLASGGADIPAVAISREDGERLLELIGVEDVQATVTVTVDSRTSQNVVAEQPGNGPGVVVLGGHYDTVPGVQGANDNGSGTAVILAIAEELAGQDLPFTVRFIAFGSEELGLRGSAHYVDSLSGGQRDEIVAMLNFDALGSGVRVEILGDGPLVDRTAELAQREGISVLRGRSQPGSGSDHASFSRAGIPVLMFTAPDVSLIHSADDTLEEVNPDLLRDTVRLAVSLLRLPNPFDQGL